MQRADAGAVDKLARLRGRWARGKRLLTTEAAFSSGRHGWSLVCTALRSMPEQPTPHPWSPLLHRWFVQYNPIYLLSAILVLAGTMLTSRGLSEEGSVYGQLGVALLAELYACALIGGAAFLVHIGQRRPAVMLGLLAVLYQGDLTLHTETCAYLGALGVVAVVIWGALFLGKLYALGLALRVRITRRAFATAGSGALGLALGPMVLPLMSPRAAGALVAVFVFALGAMCPQKVTHALIPRETLSDWGTTVMARALRATWMIWGVLLGLHVTFWTTERHVDLGLVFPALALLLAHRIRSELRHVALCLGVLGLVLLAAPPAFSATAFLCALAFARRLFSRQEVLCAEDTADERAPYRGLAEATLKSNARVEFAPRTVSERARLGVLALLCVYLGLFCFSWQGGPFPAHQWALDLGLSVALAVLAGALRARLVAALVPLAWTHAAFATGLVPVPHSALALGCVTVASGFVLLGGALWLSYRWRPAPASADRGAGR